MRANAPTSLGRVFLYRRTSHLHWDCTDRQLCLPPEPLMYTATKGSIEQIARVLAKNTGDEASR